MKLDPRIIKGKKPLTCFDVEEAKQFIGKECYFCDCPLAFEDLDKFTTLVKNVLFRVQDTEKPFLTDTIACYRYAYCLPLEWVKEKEPEPKYRPYKDYDEMSQDFSVGQTITFRDKGYDSVHYAEIVEVYENKCGDWFVVIGNGVRSFAGWFQTIEVKDPETNQWVPFGVEE